MSLCQFAMKTRRLHFFPCKATAPASLFVVVFFAKGVKTSSKLKTPHLDERVTFSANDLRMQFTVRFHCRQSCVLFFVILKVLINEK